MSYLRPLLLAVGVATALATLLLSEQPVFDESFLILLLAAIVLEVRAVPGTRYGPFGCAAAFYLAGGFVPGVGPTGALFCCLLGLLSRYLFGPPPKLAATYIADFTAVSIATMVSALIPTPLEMGFALANLAFLAGAELIGRAFFPLFKETRVTRTRFALASVVGAIPAVYLSQNEPLMNIFLAALLLIVQSGGYMRIRQEALTETNRSLRNTKSSLLQVQREKSATGQRLERTTRERELVENMAKYFARNPSESQLVQECLDALPPLFPKAKRSLWRPSGQGFELWASCSEAASQPAQQLLKKCWESQSILCSEGGSPPLILAPLPEQGVLALSLTTPVELSESRKSLLTILCSQFALGLQSAHYRGQLEQSLQLQKETNHRLQLSQEQLVQSSKMAAVGQLAAGVAHELNSPLAAALLQIQAGKLRLEGGNLEKVGKSFDAAENSLVVAQEIIEKLLGFSRISGQHDLRVDLAKAVTGAWGLVKEHFVQEHIEVKLELPEEMWVRAAPTELQQVFVNLLLNAKYACKQTRDQRPARIFVRGQKFQGRASVVVSDSGPGVGPEDAHRIFEPFFTTKPIGEGTGLGLAISFQILKAHGGAIELKNSPQGASFQVTLPLIA